MRGGLTYHSSLGFGICLMNSDRSGAPTEWPIRADFSNASTKSLTSMVKLFLTPHENSPEFSAAELFASSEGQGSKGRPTEPDVLSNRSKNRRHQRLNRAKRRERLSAFAGTEKLLLLLTPKREREVEDTPPKWRARCGEGHSDGGGPRGGYKSSHGSLRASKPQATIPVTSLGAQKPATSVPKPKLTARKLVHTTC